MFFNSYQKNQIINKRKNSENSIHNINKYSFKLSKYTLPRKQTNNLLSSLSFKSFKSKLNNYINYTVLEQIE